jgi:hypothetical protein
MVLICTIILRLTELFSCYKPVLVGLPFEPRFLICTPPVSVDLVKEGRRFNFCVRMIQPFCLRRRLQSKGPCFKLEATECASRLPA